mmetsp:Transcript_49630/g.124788  ORF Transcript_49630/g.124788 Transcript_49630/m.124788 type:complete len:222 (+) Transcript_49630:1911-2576(+)
MNVVHCRMHLFSSSMSADLISLSGRTLMSLKKLSNKKHNESLAAQLTRANVSFWLLSSASERSLRTFSACVHSSAMKVMPFFFFPVKRAGRALKKAVTARVNGADTKAGSCNVSASNWLQAIMRGRAVPRYLSGFTCPPLSPSLGMSEGLAASRLPKRASSHNWHQTAFRFFTSSFAPGHVNAAELAVHSLNTPSSSSSCSHVKGRPVCLTPSSTVHTSCR